MKNGWDYVPANRVLKVYSKPSYYYSERNIDPLFPNEFTSLVFTIYQAYDKPTPNSTHELMRNSTVTTNGLNTRFILSEDKSAKIYVSGPQKASDGISKYPAHITWYLPRPLLDHLSIKGSDDVKIEIVDYAGEVHQNFTSTISSITPEGMLLNINGFDFDKTIRVSNQP